MSAPSPPPKRTRILLVALVFGATCFAAGWWLREPTPPPAAPSRPSATATPPGPTIQLHLDAGAVELLPDASLRLRPLDPPVPPPQPR